MGSSLIGRFVGPVSTLIALCMGGWYLMHHAPTEGDLAANAGALANADPNATNPLNQSPLGSTVSNNPASPAGLGSNAVAPVSAGSSANPRNVPPAQNPQAINPGVREPARPVGIPNGPAAVPPAQPNMQQPGMPPRLPVVPPCKPSLATEFASLLLTSKTLGPRRSRMPIS